MKIKIISDGTSRGTRIVDADTGEDLGLRVTKISFSIDANNPESTVDLTLSQVPVELQGKRTRIFLPKQEIEFPERESRY